MSENDEGNRVQTSNLVRDLRLDRIVTWVLTVMVGIGVAIAAGTYKDLKTEFTSLRESITDLTTTVAVMQANEVQIKENKSNIQTLLIWKAHQEGPQP